jgi:hypothetical protein
MDNEFERILMEEAPTYFHSLSWLLPGGDEENHGKHKSK